MIAAPYTTQLGAGLGLIEETHILLDLWQPGMGASDLYDAAFKSGRFGNVSARRLRNLVTEGFVPRYLHSNGMPAGLLKRMREAVASREFEQVLFIYTCRAQTILADFVREVYWNAYAYGHDTISNDQARDWVTRVNQDGKTTTPWSDGTIRQVSGYLTGCCGDFGLLERGIRRVRKVLPYRLESRVAVFLAYDLHLAGYGDNRVIDDPDWALFGLDRADVLDELKRLSLTGMFIIQVAGEATRIGWQCDSMEQVINVLAQV